MLLVSGFGLLIAKPKSTQKIIGPMKLYQKKLFENYSRTRGVEFVDGIKDVAMVRSHLKCLSGSPPGFTNLSIKIIGYLNQCGMRLLMADIIFEV